MRGRKDGNYRWSRAASSGDQMRCHSGARKHVIILFRCGEDIDSVLVCWHIFAFRCCCCSYIFRKENWVKLNAPKLGGDEGEMVGR